MDQQYTNLMKNNNNQMIVIVILNISILLSHAFVGTNLLVVLHVIWISSILLFMLYSHLQIMI